MIILEWTVMSAVVEYQLLALRVVNSPQLNRKTLHLPYYSLHVDCQSWSWVVWALHSTGSYSVLQEGLEAALRFQAFSAMNPPPHQTVHILLSPCAAYKTHDLCEVLLRNHRKTGYLIMASTFSSFSTHLEFKVTKLGVMSVCIWALGDFSGDYTDIFCLAFFIRPTDVSPANQPV